MSSFAALVAEYGPYIAEGLLVSLEITVLALLVGIVLGFPCALMRMSQIKALRAVSGAYVELIRGTPALLQLFVIYFGLANLGLRLGAFVSAVIALGVMGGALLCEVFRAGLESVERGQVEAGTALGMSGVQVMRRVVVPQAFRLVIPPFTNFLVTLIKETSLVLTIAVPEVMYRAYSVASTTYRDMEVYVIAAAVYFVVCFPVASVARRMERKVRA